MFAYTFFNFFSKTPLGAVAPCFLKNLVICLSVRSQQTFETPGANSKAVFCFVS